MTQFALWPPKESSRTYRFNNDSIIVSSTRGQDLVSYQESLRDAQTGAAKERLRNTQLFTDLPVKFYTEYLHIQRSKQPIKFPKIRENKSVTVRSCMQEHPQFNDWDGKLHPRKWRSLGWSSLAAYNQWLDSTMLFAFSGSMHYCCPTRVIDSDKQRNEGATTSHFHFKERNPHTDIAKTTPILTVTGFEYRGFRGDVKKSLAGVEAHTMQIMRQILKIAECTQSTDVVLIPFGMGVFIKNQPFEQEIKQAMFKGMRAALIRHQGPPVKLHCCGGPGFYEQLAQAQNAGIDYVNQTGYDAYTITNTIQDAGVEEHEHETIPPALTGACLPRTRKAMLINAGDNDWTALLDATKYPGQYAAGHTLFDQTSDEYYALVTDLAHHSIQRLISVHKLQSLQQHIMQLKPESCNLHAINEEPVQQPLSDELRRKVLNHIIRLDKEIYSRWPYPNKDVKAIKKAGLENFLALTETLSIEDSLARVRTEFPRLEDGRFSTRTADLLKAVEESILNPIRAELRL